MKRVLVISTNVTRDPYPVYPLGIAAISAALIEAGHLVEQFDLLVSGESPQRLAERVIDWRPDFVCVSMRNLDSCDSLSVTGYPEQVREVVAAVRGVSSAPVVIGGAGFSVLPEELLDFTGADYGVVGEGERLVCRLLSDLEQGVPVPRLLRNDALMAGASVPSPVYCEELIGFYRAESGMINMQTKRGCPYDCAYCSYPTLEGKRFRHRDPKAVVDDLERMLVDSGISTVFFTDSIFNDCEGRYLEVVEEILSRELSLRWCCYLRPAGLGRKEVALMKRAGLHAVEVGTDAASDATLAALQKGFTFADVLEAHDAFVAERVPCAHFVMFGGPGETPATVTEGLANLERLEHTVVCAFSGIRVLPGTKLHELAVAEGVIEDGVSLLDPAYYLSPAVDARWMNAEIAASFRGRRDRIFPPEEGQKRLAILHRFGYRGLLWDTLIRFPRA